jgi:hypothetical protein
VTRDQPLQKRLTRADAQREQSEHQQRRAKGQREPRVDETRKPDEREHPGERQGGATRHDQSAFHETFTTYNEIRLRTQALSCSRNRKTT